MPNDPTTEQRAEEALRRAHNLCPCGTDDEENAAPRPCRGDPCCVCWAATKSNKPCLWPLHVHIDRAYKLAGLVQAELILKHIEQRFPDVRLQWLREECERLRTEVDDGE